MEHKQQTLFTGHLGHGGGSGWCDRTPFIGPSPDSHTESINKEPDQPDRTSRVAPCEPILEAAMTHAGAFGTL